MADHVRHHPLGELLVERGLIDRYQLEVALKEQRLTGQLLGELLVSRRLVSPIEMAAALAAHHGVHLDGSAATGAAPATSAPAAAGGWRPLGRILVERGSLSESGLQRALLAQQRTGTALGELLVQRRWVSPADIAAALAEQHGLELDEAVVESAREGAEAVERPERYALRASAADEPIFVAATFLDATDFAFELLHASDPDALEIVRLVPGGEEERVWRYTREASDAFRAGMAEERKRFAPLELHEEPGGNGAPAAA